MKALYGFSLLALVWSIYYLAMHVTGGILTLAEAVICGCVILFCAIALAHGTIQYIRRKK